MNIKRYSPQSRQQRGIALVIVLAMLVLLSVMIIGFFISVTTERQASNAATGAIQSRQIADTTVSLAITQIRDATSQSDKGAAWASQPGAIRTYGTSGADVWKIYSADKMSESESTYDPAADSFWPADAKERRFGFVDLNEPAIAADGSKNYPIINPSAKFDLAGTKTSTKKDRLIEGFDCADLNDPVNTSIPLLPLNVKWLYVLKDGSIGTLDTLSNDPDTNKHPSRVNPVVARTAFWGDDESAKINLNTASEPTFWDSPIVSTYHELGDVADGNKNSGYVIGAASQEGSLNLAVAQPVQGEFQRYPGHPATTSLSPVFRRLFAAASTHSDKAYKDLVYQIAPHIYSDVSIKTGWTGGLSTAAATVNKGLSGYTQLPDDGDRLFASVDELMFTGPRRNANNTLLENSSLLPGLNPQVLDRMRFFLTAQSRAPEMNLSGRPRVAIWPVPREPASGSSLRTGFDKAFAFTSTLWPADPTTGAKTASKQKAYYFTRKVVPGTDQSGSGSRDAFDDYTGDPRNQGVYNYLHTLMSTDIPGFKGKFSTKYASDSDQILTEIFDYIRCTNLVDGTGRDQLGNPRSGALSVATRYSQPYGSGSETTDSTTTRPNDWSGQVIPIKITSNNTKGLGRFLTLSEVAIAFFVPQYEPYDGGTEVTATVKDGTHTMRAALVFEFSTPMAGYLGLRDTYSFKVTEEEPLLVTPSLGGTPNSPIFPTGTGKLLGYCACEVDALNSTNGRPHTANRGFTTAMLKFTDAASGSSIAKKFVVSGTIAGSPKSPDNYPFISSPIPISDKPETTFTMKGGTYTLELFAGLDPSDTTKSVQTIHFTIAPDLIKDVPFPKPWMVQNGTFTSGPNKDKPKFVGRKFETNVKEGGSQPLFGNGNLDIVRSTALKTGDYRLTSAMADVMATMFDLPPTSTETKSDVATADGKVKFNAAKYRIVHVLRYGHGDAGPGLPAAQTGRFAPGGDIRASKPPDLFDTINGVLRKDGGPGDWGRGVSKHVDGALANKPDEGNTKFDDSQTGIYRLPYMRGPNSRIADDTNFSPNRLIPSPVVFGSLPTGIQVQGSWQTLLFRPDRNSGSAHPGAATAANPADHLLLDLFWMPVVEPYAISEPCSTAGKINLNFAIAPFGYLRQGNGTTPYIQRDTGLRAVLKGVKLLAVPTKMPNGGHREGKNSETDGNGGLADSTSVASMTGSRVRFDIDPDLTVRDIADRLYKPNPTNDLDKGLFRCASQICDVDLYPYTANSDYIPPGTDTYPDPYYKLSPQTIPKTAADFKNFWDDNGLTGDQGREGPYARIYPRVTTKSNIFTIHLRTQTVQVPQSYYSTGATGALNVAQMKTDFASKGDVVKVASEYRGSATVERFIDPNDPALATYTTGNDELSKSLDPYYRFRIVNTKRFTP